VEALKNRGKHTEIAFGHADERFTSIYAESPIGIEIYDAKGHLLDANRACLDMFELCDVSEFRFRTLFGNPYIPEKAKEELRRGNVARYEAHVDFDEFKRLGLHKRTKSGIAYYAVVISPLGVERGLPNGYLQQIQDVTESKRAETALRELSRRLVELQESERRHIASELHDQIGQSLTGLKLLLEMAARKPAESIGLALTEAQRLINELMARVGDLSLDLRPSMLDDLGLLPTLLWHFERYAAQTGVHVVFKHRGIRRRFAPQVETAVYRIVQEALTNVARHARVQTANVQVRTNRGRLIVEIQDHGAGFDAEAVLRTSMSSGLVGMQERAVALKGKLVVRSGRQQGTCVFAELPLAGSRGRRGV